MPKSDTHRPSISSQHHLKGNRRQDRSNGPALDIARYDDAPPSSMDGNSSQRWMLEWSDKTI